MVKNRPGSRKGLTKFTGSVKKSSKKIAAKSRGKVQEKTVLHTTMRSSWDSTKNASENLQRVGLRASVNSMIKSKRRGRVLNVQVATIPQRPGTLFNLEKAAALPEKGSKQVVHPGEKLALQGLVDRYGDDWDAMARDIKLNYLQWTAVKLQKKVERMQALACAK